MLCKKYLNPISLALLFSVIFSSSSTASQSGIHEGLMLQDLFNLEYAAKPVAMPDGKRVVYERRSMDIMTDSVRRNLWVASLDGKQQSPLLSDSENHFSPVFSPDGSKMAYLSTREGNVQIYWLDLATGNTARVTDVPMSPNNISFSPDGKQIAFSMFTPNKVKPVFNLDFKPEGAQWALYR
jgi:dipeptidyl aminopeptidase/acylaminoacyl peptidase